MKKKVVIIIIIIAAIVAAILIGSHFYPPPKGSDTSGTVGKAEKFRKGQFTEEDILLRDDILKDTAAVGKTLDQILAFTSFMQQEKLIIDTLWIAQIKKSCPTYPDCPECAYCYQAINLLQDYSTFLSNKEQTVKETIDVLLAAYNGKSKDFTFDVGVKLLSFVQFIDEMVERDSVLTSSIKLVDQYLNKGKVTDKKRQAEITRLKKVRDHMVIDNLLFAMKTGDKKQSEVLANIPFVSSADVVNTLVSGQEPVIDVAQNVGSSAPQVAAGLDNIPVFYNIENLPDLGVYSEGRVENALYSVTIVAIDYSNIVVYNTPVIANILNVENIGNISPVASNNTIENIVGDGFGNVVTAAPIDLFSATDGTVFNSEAMVSIIEPN